MTLDGWRDMQGSSLGASPNQTSSRKVSNNHDKSHDMRFTIAPSLQTSPL
jgi:hypothetical protein